MKTGKLIDYEDIYTKLNNIEQIELLLIRTGYEKHRYKPVKTRNSRV